MISGMFYKAVVQQVLLFGAETWTVTPAMMKALEGFHHRAARRIAGMQPYRLVNGDWVTPDKTEALEATGLWPIAEYVRRRHATVAKWVAERPIMELCRAALPMSGRNIHRARWWHQNMEVNELDG